MAEHDEGPGPRIPLGPLALVAVVGLVVGMGLFRIAPIDVPWHLATGRLMWEQGVFPTTNTFSWTHPDYPLYQQYPAFQLAMYGALTLFGWEGISVLVCASWTTSFLLWMGWGGRRAVALPLVWFFAAVGLQRHLVPRPEMFTMVALPMLLLCFDALRRGHRAAALGIVAVQWFLVNSHQMFPLGLALQGLFLVHLVTARTIAPRLGLSDDDKGVPLAPPALALVGSVAVLGLSPLGLEVYLVPLKTLETVLVQGQGASTGAQAAELAPFWTDPIATVVVAVLLPIALLSLWRSRGRWSLLELGVLALGTLMVGVAIRGIHFFALMAAAVITRTSERQDTLLLPPNSPVHPAGAVATLAMAGTLTFVLQSTPAAYLSVQRGIGRSQGEWADDTISFLAEHPPPGRMLNLGWVVGNPMIWGLYPEQRVFVDPRWEAYPKEFLTRAIAAMEDGEALATLLEEYQPGFVVAEQRLPEVQDRMGELIASGDWHLVHVDSLLVVLVADRPEAEGYLARHRIDPSAVTIDDWLPEYPLLHAQQQVRMSRFHRAMGNDARAQQLEARARSLGDPRIDAELAAP